MHEPLTEELLEELLAAPCMDSYLEGREFPERTLSGYLQQLLEQKGLDRPAVIRTAGINETYGYQIFTGQKTNPSRNYVLRLAFAMKLTLQETNWLLQTAGANALYYRNRRDAIIIFCLDRGFDLQRTDEELYRFGEETVG